MCGIFALFGSQSADISDKREYLLQLSKKIRHRGPDWNGIYFNPEKKVAICHERLSIVGVDNGSQPIIDEENEIILSVNGEIYNYQQLYETVLHNKYNASTSSDCEIIIHLYKEFGPEFVKMLDGIFSFVLYDNKSNKVIAARDPIGITTLYMGRSKEYGIMFSSEMKSLIHDCQYITHFTPGNYIVLDNKIDDSDNNLTFINYYTPFCV